MSVMSESDNLLSELGLDESSVQWQDLASCNGMEINWFYDDYEQDQVHAKNIDNICLNCPVIAMCAKEGKRNKEEGVWGGIYWNGQGKIDQNKNRHKDNKIWLKLEERTGIKKR